MTQYTLGTQEGNLCSIKKDGTLKWKFKAENSITASPAIDANGVIYVGSWDGNVYAINSDGTISGVLRLAIHYFLRL